MPSADSAGVHPTTLAAIRDGFRTAAVHQASEILVGGARRQ
jgi:hypothetical protein